MVEPTKQIGSILPSQGVRGSIILLIITTKVRLLEVNLRNIGMVHHQLIGGPLFGDYTQEVASFAKQMPNRRRFIFISISQLQLR